MGTVIHGRFLMGNYFASAPTSEMASELVKTSINGSKVFVFSKSFCPFCHRAKAALKDLNVSFDAMELDQRQDGSSIQDALKDLTGGRSVPRVFVGGEFVGGCDDTLAQISAGTLQEKLKAAGAL